jgi:hypothetical protein
MRIVQPISSMPVLAPRHSSVRRLHAPSRLPVVYPTQPSALQRLLRALGFGR